MSGCSPAVSTKVIRVDRHIRSSLKFSSPVKNARLLSPFGPRDNSYHTGADLKGSGAGSQYAVAALEGRVIKTGWIRGYGNIVELEHANKFRTRYAHLKKISVKLGQRLERAAKVGVIGSTGRASGVHLHFEIFTPEGRFTDPCLFIQCSK